MPRSDSLGRAFEYICIRSLESEISKVRPVSIVENSNYLQDKANWDALDACTQEMMEKEAIAAIPTIMDLEPMIEECNNDVLTLKLQSDREGVLGDVRDILLMRCEEEWMIGISVKHNHFAVKHSRLSSVLDFGESWFDIPCSREYWNDIAPIFSPLEQNRGMIAWRDLEDKENSVYVPLLRAFIREVLRCNDQDESVPRKMVEYLLGKYDFYKLVGIDRESKTNLIAFNLRGTLNRPSSNSRPRRTIPTTLLPSRIVSFCMKPNSSTTAELYMDNGWQFSFRIHNASTMVEPSLKFDIQIIGMPTTIVTIHCSWR